MTIDIGIHAVANRGEAEFSAPQRRRTVERFRAGHHKLYVAAAALLAIATGAACQPTTVPVGTVSGIFTSGSLTPDGTDTYRVTGTAANITVAAPASNTGANLRQAITTSSARASVDQRTCATWSTPGSPTAQPGVVLRSVTTTNRARAIMVTNNVSFGVRSIFNIHLADSAARPQLLQVTSVMFPDGIGDWDHTKPYPWRLCARVIGTTLQVKAWAPSHGVEPAWNDPRLTISVQLPSSWVYSGTPGTYMGHLDPGAVQTLSNVVTAASYGTPASSP